MASVNDDSTLQELQRRGVTLRGPTIGTRFRSFAGQIMAFRRDNGQALWSRPVQVSQFYLPSFQPAELPILPLYRSTQQRLLRAEELGGPARALQLQNEMVFIDLRSGGLVLRAENPPGIWRTMLLRGDPRSDTMELLTEQGPLLGLGFSDEAPEAGEPAILEAVQLPEADPRPIRDGGGRE
jgi:hypothetical protein